MPLKNYGVWVGYPISYEAERAAQDSKSPHIELYYDTDADASKGKDRAAINVKSTTKDSRLVYWFYRDFKHPITSDLETLDVGYHDLPSDEKGGLDYIRGNLLQNDQGTLVESDVPGDNNDIIDYMSPILDNAISSKAKIYLFGSPFKNGIHDIHMNQGNDGSFAKDNGIYQDGGILIEFTDGHWEAVFLAFAVQKIHTDDETGDSVGNVDWADYLGSVAPSTPTTSKDATGDASAPSASTESEWHGKVFIRAALVNPVGPDEGKEVVYLQNRTSTAIEVDGWTIQNRQGQKQALSGSISPSSYKGFKVDDCPLPNQGGTITLLENQSGLKVDGVSYTKQQVRREGKLVYFH